MSLSARESVDHAVNLFHTFSEGRPLLLPTGIKRLDAEIGGLGPGSTMIIGAENGLGKSSVKLDAAITNAEAGVRTGILSCEDTPDVLGCRILARFSEVDSRKIRRKAFSAEEEKRLRAGAEKARAMEENLRISYHVGSPLEEVRDGLKELADEGCEVVWMDYIQKVRGVTDDRRNEVSRVYTSLHNCAAKLGVGIIFLSQIRRPIDRGKPHIPSRFALKESGDLENEARLILMLGKLDLDDDSRIDGRLDKSTFGGEGMLMQWRRGPCGTLFQVDWAEESRKPVSDENFDCF